MGHEHTQDSNLLRARCKDYPKCAAIMVAQNGTTEPRMMSCRSRAMKHRVAAWESMPWEAGGRGGAERGERTGDMMTGKNFGTLTCDVITLRHANL